MIVSLLTLKTMTTETRLRNEAGFYLAIFQKSDPHTMDTVFIAWKGYVMDSLFGSLRNVTGLIVAAVLGLFALLLLLRTIQGWTKAASSRNWATTNGRVLSSTLQRTRRRGGGGGGSYIPLVVYEYEVNGQRYQGNRYAFGSQVGIGVSGIAARALEDYPVGAIVDVYYNPDNLADATLKRNAGGEWSNLIGVIVLAAAAVFVLVRFGGVRLPF